MSDSEWPLDTSLERLKSPANEVEPALLRNFRKYAPRGTFARDSDWEALAVAQHNGLPTRLLDWCVSPLIAVHFATVEREYLSKHGVVWCVDVNALRDQVLPPDIAKLIKKPLAALYDVALLETAYPKLADFDKTRKALGEACIFFEPPSLDARIANQTGVLSAMNGPDVSHQRYMETVAAAHPDVVRRIVIHKSAKSEIRDKLDQNNIHERMLFPGLPGLCAWLKRYYGPA
jgi:FRG domain-containing protein